MANNLHFGGGQGLVTARTQAAAKAAKKKREAEASDWIKEVRARKKPIACNKQLTKDDTAP